MFGNSGESIGAEVTSVGDINGDGIDDMAIGAPYTNDNLGKVYVIYGQNEGSPDIYLSMLTYEQGFSVTGSDSGGVFGFAIASAGDQNGDSVDDMMISAPFANSGKGIVYVIYGTLGYRSNFNVAMVIHSGGFRIYGSEISGNLGYSIIGVDDVTGDGVSDILMSAPYVDHMRGRTYLIYGTYGVKQDFSVDALTSHRGCVFSGSQSGAKSGVVVARVGDLNGDGVADFAIGEPLAETQSRGAVRVIFGCKHHCFPASMPLLELSSRGFSIIGAGSFHRLGSAICAAGDINGDGVDDVLVSSFIANNVRGAVYVVYGSPTFAASINLASLNPSQVFSVSGSGVGLFGVSLAGKFDLDHDGTPDILVGNPNGGDISAYALLGSDELFSSATSIDKLPSSSMFRVSTAQAYDESGQKIAAVGDFNDDGFLDVAMSAAGAVISDTKAGAVYVIYDVLALGDAILTHSPIFYPTASPTVVPTHRPSRSPTVHPTHKPSDPTMKPTQSPTKSPNSTPDPTLSPSRLPTHYPTLHPTYKPSLHPTRFPTQRPSSIPTTAPTASPATSQPSNIPTAEPTYAPNLSERPTTPTFFPTLLPTRLPTFAPTCVPTAHPTAVPTVHPTRVPSHTPTRRPTCLPTRSPTSDPTLSPTPLPSWYPTPYPTNAKHQSIIFVTECETVLGSDGDDQFIVDTAKGCRVLLQGGNGRDVYTVHPSPSSAVTISDYDTRMDKIDLRYFPHIKSFKQVNMTRGSVIIHLPQLQTIVITNHFPADMKSSNFVFVKPSKTDGIFVGFAMIMFFVVMGIGIVCVCNHVMSNVEWEFTSNFFEKDRISDVKQDDESVRALPSQHMRRSSVRKPAAREPDLEVITEVAAPPLESGQQSSSYYNISSLDSMSMDSRVKSESNESGASSSWSLNEVSDISSSSDESVEMELQEKMLEMASRLPYKLPLAYMSKQHTAKSEMMSSHARRNSTSETSEVHADSPFQDEVESCSSGISDKNATSHEEHDEYLSHLRNLASEFSMQLSFGKLNSESDDENSL